MNKHSTACHGQYFSLAGNCFVPIQAADLRSRMDKLRGPNSIDTLTVLVPVPEVGRLRPTSTVGA